VIRQLQLADCWRSPWQPYTDKLGVIPGWRHIAGQMSDALKVHTDHALRPSAQIELSRVELGTGVPAVARRLASWLRGMPRSRRTEMMTKDIAYSLNARGKRRWKSTHRIDLNYASQEWTARVRNKPDEQVAYLLSVTVSKTTHWLSPFTFRRQLKHFYFSFVPGYITATYYKPSTYLLTYLNCRPYGTVQFQKSAMISYHQHRPTSPYM